MVVIIIVNYNGIDDTIKCIDSIKKSTFKNFKIILVDNKSPNGDGRNLGIMYEHDEQVVFIQSDYNKGFAYGNNIGTNYALDKINDIEYIWYLNNDTIIKNNTLSILYSSINKVPKNVGILGTKMLFLDNPLIIQNFGGRFNKYSCRCYHIGAYEKDCGQYDRISLNPDYIVGASMFVRLEFIKDVGLMNEDYFLYFEELDWIERGKRKGWEISYVSNAPILHKEGGSTIDNNKLSSFAEKCQIRSRCLFMKRFYKGYLISFIFFSCLTILKKLFKRNYKLANELFCILIKTLVYEK